MGQLGVLLEERNILADPGHSQDLQAATGKTRVPVLRIEHADGGVEWLPESRDIIRYLREKFSDKYPDEPVDFAPKFSWLPLAPWVLLLAGGLSPEPLRHGVWALTCAGMALRSLQIAAGSSSTMFHRVMAGMFAAVGTFIALDGLGVMTPPWWYLVYVAAFLLMVAHVVQLQSGR